MNIIYLIMSEDDTYSDYVELFVTIGFCFEEHYKRCELL